MGGSGSRGGRGGRGPAFDEAVRLLASRALSEQEVRQRLARRGHPGEAIEEAVARLARLGYLDDRQLAYNVASSLSTRRWLGKARVAAELEKRGVPEEVIAAALERAFAEADETELALTAARKLAARAGGEAPGRTAERVARALLRRGFPRAVVSRALRQTLGEEAISRGSPMVRRRPAKSGSRRSHGPSGAEEPDVQEVDGNEGNEL